MLTWASPFNICCFLDNHSYSFSSPAFECLLGVGAAERFSAAAGHAFSGLRQWAAGREDWLLGHFGYGLTAETEPAPGIAAVPDAVGFPDCFFFVPVHLILLQKDSIRIGSLEGDPGEIWRQMSQTTVAESARPAANPSEPPSGPSQPAASTSPPTASPAPAGPSRPAAGPFQPTADLIPPAGASQSAASLFQPSASPIPPAAQPAAGLSFIPRFTRAEYLSTVSALQQHILRGDCYEINFCQEFYARPAQIDPYATWRALSLASPNPFAAFYRLGARYLLCASPERFLKKSGDQLFSSPIKGTAPRHRQDATADEQQRQRLHASGKDRAENVMVVDLVRNDLARICKPGSVRVAELFGIYAFPQVYQMISTITGEMVPGADWTDAVRACFPMGSMTGAPKNRVVQLIARYERSGRGLFSGAVGYVTPMGDFDFNVVIRSLLYDQESRYLSYQVGSGITFYSDPEAEYEECLVKAEGIRKALNTLI
jgi:para-aminobenzoate synthetase component 1